MVDNTNKNMMPMPNVNNLTIDELKTLLETDVVQSQAGLVTLLEGILKSKENDLAVIKAKQEYADLLVIALEDLPLPPHNQGIANIFLNVTEVDDGKGHKILAWNIKLNHTCGISNKASGDNTNTATKRAISVLKREGNNLLPIGNFRNSAEACGHLNIECKGDSARRKLLDNDYLVDSYNGTEYTIAK